MDADVFITAKNLYYAFDICPGFWAGIIHHYENARVFSIDRVRGELLAGRKGEDLVEWVKNDLPEAFFLDTDDEEVADHYTQIMLWVQRNPQFFDNAKAQFATGADGWLVAYAMTHEVTVVTNEQPRPEVKSRVPLPNVCQQFDVEYTTPFSMLRDLTVCLIFEAAP